MSDLVRTCARLTNARRVVVGLSGGRDSVVLLDALVRSGADVRAAHVDHQLRSDSAHDAAFCAELAANYGVPFASAKLRIVRGNSTQGRARIQRYAALVRLCSELGGDALAIAHHADDAWESSVLQTDRGAGPQGSAGPQTWGEWHGMPVVRPMLDFRSSDIAAHAAEFGLRWREDPSNTSPAYARNKLRLEGAHFDGRELERRRKEGATLALRAAALSTEQIGPLRIRLTPGDAPGDAVARALLDQARRLHGEIPRGTIDVVLDALSQKRNGRFCGRRVTAIVCDGQVDLQASRGQGTRLADARSTATVFVRRGRLPWFGDHLVVSDTAGGEGAEQIALRTIARVVLRGATPRDRIASAGLGGSQRIHELLAAAGVPRHERWKWPCVFADERCLWVCGIRVAEPDSMFLLPRGALSGIFVRWEAFHPTDSAGKVVVAER